jgi:hypothetical protein
MRKLNLKLVLLFLTAIFTFSASAIELNVNGFGSFFYGQALSDSLYSDGFKDKHANFTDFSLFGLNLGASVTPDLDFVAQIAALGDPVGRNDGFGLFAQWAYLNYKPAAGTSLKLGRQLYPTLMASEYANVGYLLPFRQLPDSVNLLNPFTRFDGAAAYRTLDTAAGKLTLGIFGGTPILDIDDSNLGGYSFRFGDLIGTQASLDGDGWRVHAQASRFYSAMTLSAPLPAGSYSGLENIYTAGFRYDKHSIVTWGEYMWVRTPNGTPLAGGHYAEKGEGGFLLLGYRLGNFMPRYTYARAIADFNVSANGETASHTVGVNYQVGRQAVIKAEYERTMIPEAQHGGYFVTQTAGSTAKSGDAFYLGTDFIF